MYNYAILTESTCDLPAQLAAELDLHVVRLHVLLDGKDYENYLDGRELSFKSLYDSMREKKLPTTSLATYDSFYSEMKEILDAGQDILYIGFSSTMSGTQNNGRLAAADLLEQYPERRIEIVDSLSASIGEGLLVYLCAGKRKDGASLDEVAAYAREAVPHMSHFFTVNDLMHVMRGGRATKSSAILGSMLGIKPIMNVNDDGLMDKLMTIRGRKQSIRKIVELVKENMESPDAPVFVGHGDCIEEAEQLAAMLRNECGITDITISYIGAVCGCHAGPGVLAVFYVGKKR